MKRKTIVIQSEFIKLDSFLKYAGIADTGGMAKNLVLDGLVMVDGEICKMRGKKLYPGMIVSFEGQELEVQKQ